MNPPFDAERTTGHGNGREKRHIGMVLPPQMPQALLEIGGAPYLYQGRSFFPCRIDPATTPHTPRAKIRHIRSLQTFIHGLNPFCGAGAACPGVVMR